MCYSIDSRVDPSLQDRQRQLKKARLQDSLNEHLLHRPGPLDLVQGNILPADPDLKDAINGKFMTKENIIMNCVIIVTSYQCTIILFKWIENILLTLSSLVWSHNFCLLKCIAF